MVRRGDLSEVLEDFARTMLTDFPMQAILDRLVDRIVVMLPVTAAGVTLISPGLAPRYIAASDESAMRFERLQTDLGQGPCLAAYHSGHPVAVPDLEREQRFPAFVEAALAAGLAAVYTFPLRHEEGQIGALDLYRDASGVLHADDLAAAQTLADVAAAYVLNAQARDEARATADRFRNIALHDLLTGLPNRLLLQQRLEHAARRAERSHTNAAVLFADLDRFKEVNDTYGHQAGDDLLVAVAHRLASLVRPGDTLARVSGDEFVFLCEDLPHADDVVVLAARIDEALAVPFALAGAEIAVSMSVGMAYAGPGEAITEQLLVDADLAMYKAKRGSGGERQIIDLRQPPQAAPRSSLGKDLHRALNRNELEIAYQPIVRSTDGLVAGVEALLRWTNPDRGPVPAMDLVRIAEDSGLINQLGAWVLERSCVEASRWMRDRQQPPFTLSVNVSARQLINPDFTATVASALEKADMNPGSLVLELTEGLFIHESTRTMMVMADLKTLGVRLALDDFGTGYSSLSYLQQFPVDFVKIDRTFIAGMPHDPVAAAIVTAVTRLAHALDMAVVAEGVETRQQRDEIVDLGCHYAQGYFYAPALAAPDLSALLASESVASLPRHRLLGAN
jgi:diguanylate cyclase (GGDEF)-like protein